MLIQDVRTRQLLGAFLIIVTTLNGWFYVKQTLVPLIANLYGKSAEAKISSRWELHGKSTAYMLLLNYDLNGKVEFGEKKVTRGFYDEVKVGDRLAIHYWDSMAFWPSIDQEPPDTLWGILWGVFGSIVFMMGMTLYVSSLNP